MAQTVEQQMNKILTDYSKGVVQETNEAFDEVSQQCVQKLKSTSPKRKVKGGKYARSWTVKVEKGGTLTQKTNTVIVHNKVYQLTHLLENGHIIRNAKGTYGRVAGIKHIAPVEEWAAEELPNMIKRKLST